MKLASCSALTGGQEKTFKQSSTCPEAVTGLEMLNTDRTCLNRDFSWCSSSGLTRNREADALDSFTGTAMGGRRGVQDTEGVKGGV